MTEIRKVWVIVWFLIILFTTSTLGYMMIEGLSFLEALYMTVITISTVGFREVVDLSPSGKMFTVFIILAGLGTGAYALTSITSFVLEGKFKDIVRRSRMEKKIADLENHYIICGAGKTGQHVVSRFEKSREPFVVVEKNEEKFEELIEKNILAIHGDATHEDILLKAQIEKAKGLISTLSTDAENVFTVLTARTLSENLYIVARAIDEKASEKLMKAGADNTVSPNEIGGLRMASLVLRPAVVSFLDVMTRAGDVVLDLEEVRVCQGSSVIGMTLEEASIPGKTGLVVMAIDDIKDTTKKLTLNPRPDYVIKKGDRLVVLGQPEQINKLRAISCEE